MSKIHSREPKFNYMSKIHSKFTYSACGPFTENEKRTKISRRGKEDKNLKKSKNIFIKTTWTKLRFSMTWLMEILRIYLNISKNSKYGRYQLGLASMVY